MTSIEPGDDSAIVSPTALLGGRWTPLEAPTAAADTQYGLSEAVDRAAAEVHPADLPSDLLAPESTHPPVDERPAGVPMNSDPDPTAGSGPPAPPNPPSPADGRDHEREDPQPDRSLKSAASRAFGWSFINTVVGRFGTLAIGIVLARLLGPAEFGTFAIATVAMIAVLSFNELGVSLAIVRWEGDPRHIVPTVNTISLSMSLLLVGAMVATAPVFASAMGDPEATSVVQLMSLSVLINGIVASPAALMQRNFQGGRRMAVDQVNTWLGAGVSLTLALLGFGAMSLAIGRIAGSVVSGVMFLAWSPLPYRLGLDRSKVLPLLRFGLPLAGASVIVFASGYADQLVAGSQLGATALGFYVLAFNLSSWPVSIFSQPLRNVAPAAFARLQHDPTQMSTAFATVLGLLACVAFPVCALLIGTAGPIIGLVYGSAWAASAPVLLWLGLMAAFRIVFELTYDFLVVRGQSRAIFVAQLTWLVVSVPGLLIGARFGGLAGVALAQVGVALVVMVPFYAVLLSRTGVRIAAAGRTLLLPVLASGAVAAVAFALGRILPNTFVTCLCCGFVGILAVAALLFVRRGDLDSSGLLDRFRRRPA